MTDTLIDCGNCGDQHIAPESFCRSMNSVLDAYWKSSKRKDKWTPRPGFTCTVLGQGRKVSKPVYQLSPAQVDLIDRLTAELREAGVESQAAKDLATLAEAGQLTGQITRSLIDKMIAQAREARRQGASERQVAAPATAQVPDGRYALDPVTEGGNTTVFYRVWTGHTRTLVFRQLGAFEERVPFNQIPGVLARIAADPQEAMLRYGREIGVCGHCNRPLTNDESRQLGIGPICRSKMGW